MSVTRPVVSPATVPAGIADQLKPAAPASRPMPLDGDAPVDAIYARVRGDAGTGPALDHREAI